MSHAHPPAHARDVHAKDKCPVCGRPAVPELKPFCSRRCADVDLSRWLGGVYRIPGNETEPGREEEEGSGG